MPSIGLCCFMGRGHLEPMMSLGRRLQVRGHHVTVFHLALAEPVVRRRGLDFRRIDVHEDDDSTRTGDARGAKRTVDAMARHARRMLAEGPAAMQAARVWGVVADQSDIGAGTVAEYLGLPYVTICNAPPFFLTSRRPPPFVGWSSSRGACGRARNALANAIVRQYARPLLRLVNEQRCRWGLRELRDVNEFWSGAPIITQVPASFDLIDDADQRLAHAGPLDAGDDMDRVAFPWERLGGRPIVFASMGTIRNHDIEAFRTIAAACASIDVQLVLSLGGGALLPQHLIDLPGAPIVVHFAPQRALIARSALVVNCAGMNTTLDALGAGVPIVGIPVAEDQPGVAARIRHAGVGLVIRRSRLTVGRLRRAVREVISNPVYRGNASRFQRQFTTEDGAERAAALVEAALGMTADSPRRAVLVS